MLSMQVHVPFVNYVLRALHCMQSMHQSSRHCIVNGYAVLERRGLLMIRRYNTCHLRFVIIVPGHTLRIPLPTAGRADAMFGTMVTKPR